MKIQVVMQGSIYITSCTKELRKKIDEHLTFDNPEYFKAKQLGYSVYGKPRYIKMMSIVGNDTIKIPRGYRKWLLELFDATAVEYEFIDLNTYNSKNKRFTWNKEIKLRDYQQEVVDSIENENMVVLSAGAGKTITACGIINKVNQRTLWLTHTKDLMYQSKEVLERVLGVSVGVIGDGKEDYKHDITVATVQTLAKREKILDNLKESIGCVVVDEAHHTPSTMFTKILGHLRPGHIYGLTATNVRKDGKDYLLDCAFGDIVSSITREELYGNGRLLIPTVKPVYTDFSGTTTDSTSMNIGGDGSNYAELVSILLEDVDRFDLIIKTLKEEMKSRRFIIIGDRIEYLEKINDAINREDVMLITGKLKNRTRDIILNGFRDGTVHSLIATSQLVREGLDLPELEGIAIVTPMAGDKRGHDGSALEQAVGRVQRVDKNNLDKQPIVIDFVDYESGIFKNQWYSRRKVYKRLGMSIPKKETKSMADLLDDLVF